MDSHRRSVKSPEGYKDPLLHFRLNPCKPRHTQARRDESRCAARQSPWAWEIGYRTMAIQAPGAIRNSRPALQLVGKQERAELLAIGFLNIDKRVLAVEMRDDEVSNGRDAQRLSEVFRIFQRDEGFAVLLNRKDLYGS